MTECPASVRSLIDSWVAPQLNMHPVRRWTQYEEPACRAQNNLQHAHSLAFIGNTIAWKLKDHSLEPLDLALLSMAFIVHDMGEGEIGHDTLYHFKTVLKDIEEYEAFMRRHGRLDATSAAYAEKAFLLQFCLKPEQDLALFPAHAQAVMRRIASTHEMEARVFNAIEHFDYALYAMEQYLDRSNAGIFLKVVGIDELPHMKRACAEIPGFEEEVWTSDLQQWTAESLAALAA